MDYIVILPTTEVLRTPAVNHPLVCLEYKLMSTLNKKGEKYKLHGGDSPLSPTALSIELPQEPIENFYGSIHCNLPNFQFYIQKEDIINDNYDPKVIWWEDYVVGKLRPDLKAKEDDKKQKKQDAKTEAILERRKQFNRIRPQLFLQMLDMGIPYVCNYPGCEEYERLHIDHIVPIARGGGDEIENMQFLCHSHNSSKGGR